jgi:hypothetical protein
MAQPRNIPLPGLRGHHVWSPTPIPTTAVGLYERLILRSAYHCNSPKRTRIEHEPRLQNIEQPERQSKVRSSLSPLRASGNKWITYLTCIEYNKTFWFSFYYGVFNFCVEYFLINKLLIQHIICSHSAFYSYQTNIMGGDLLLILLAKLIIKYPDIINSRANNFTKLINQHYGNSTRRFSSKAHHWTRFPLRSSVIFNVPNNIIWSLKTIMYLCYTVTSQIVHFLHHSSGQNIFQNTLFTNNRN